MKCYSRISISLYFYFRFNNVGPNLILCYRKKRILNLNKYHSENMKIYYNLFRYLKNNFRFFRFSFIFVFFSLPLETWIALCVQTTMDWVDGFCSIFLFIFWSRKNSILSLFFFNFFFVWIKFSFFFLILFYLIFNKQKYEKKSKTVPEDG